MCYAWFDFYWKHYTKSTVIMFSTSTQGDGRSFTSIKL